MKLLRETRSHKTKSKILRIAARLAAVCGALLFTTSAPVTTMAAGTHLDTSFATTGRTNFSFASGSVEDAYAVAIQPDGKIVVAGRVNVDGGWNFGVARLKTDGTPDNTFDGDGLLTIDFGGIDEAYAVAITPDNKIVVAGDSIINGNGNFAVARLTSLGVPDPTFGVNGKATFDFQGDNDLAYAIGIQPDLKIVLVGYAGMASRDWAMMRVTEAGVPDQTFGTNGRVTTDFNSQIDEARGVVVLGDGRIVIAGTVSSGSTSDMALARYTSAGVPDNGFQTGGKLTIDIAGGSTDTVRALEKTPDGKLVIGGEATGTGYPMLALVRCSIDGVLDNTFDGDGKSVVSFNNQGNNYMGGIAVNPAGEIAVAARIDGWSITSGFNVIRFKSNGKVDSRFGAGGRVNTIFGLGEKVAYDVAFQTDGRIVAVGTVRGYNDFGVARYNARGIATTSDFDGDGRAEIGVYRPSQGLWYLQDSVTGAKKYVPFGIDGDEPVLGDYDGDGITDVAVYRHSTGTWYINGSDGRANQIPFGLSSDLPVPGDYDGDGITDIAVYRLSSGYWYIQKSTGGLLVLKYGNDTSYPVPADYDGDGATDIAVFRSGDKTWWIHQSHLGDKTVQFGGNGDLPIPADYDGDGAADIAVYRFDGNWWVQRSQTNTVTVDHWGLGTDLTTPADFDGDGKANLSVFRPSTGVWYTLRGDGTIQILEWGVSGDVPLAGLTLRALA